MLNSFITVSCNVFYLEEIREKIALYSEEAFIYILNNSYREERGDIEIAITLNERYFILSFIDRKMLEILLIKLSILIESAGFVSIVREQALRFLGLVYA